MFNYVFYSGPPGKHLRTTQENLHALHVGWLRHVVGLQDMSIDVLQESKIRETAKYCI
jgi:hypothetical protein